MGPYFVTIPLLDHGKFLCCCCFLTTSVVLLSQEAHLEKYLPTETQTEPSLAFPLRWNVLGEMHYLSEGENVRLNRSSSIHLLGPTAEPHDGAHTPAWTYASPPFFFLFVTRGKAGKQELYFAFTRSTDKLPQLCAYSPFFSFLPLPGTSYQPRPALLTCIRHLTYSSALLNITL